MEEQDTLTMYYLRNINDVMTFQSIKVIFRTEELYEPYRNIYEVVDDDLIYDKGALVVESDSLTFNKEIIRKNQRRMRLGDINRAMSSIENNLRVLREIGAIQ